MGFSGEATTVCRWLRSRRAGLPSGENIQAERHVVTVLDKELKRQVTVDGAEYTVSVNPEGFRLTGKGKRKPEVQLLWRDLLNGDVAMAVALNASLSGRPPAAEPDATQLSRRAGKPSARKTTRHGPSS